MRTVRRLRLRFLLDLGSSPTLLSTRLLIALSMLVQAHQKDFSTDPVLGNNFPKHSPRTPCHNRWLALQAWDKSPFGGPGRYCPAVQNTFLSASYSNNLLTELRNQSLSHPFLRLVFRIKKRTANVLALVYPKPGICIHSRVAILDQFHDFIYLSRLSFTTIQPSRSKSLCISSVT